MKVKEIIRQINDPKIYIEIIEKGSEASLGIYTKKEIFFNDNLTKKTIDNINIQYINKKRLLILKVK